jgi:hypothetical protein
MGPMHQSFVINTLLVCSVGHICNKTMSKPEDVGEVGSQNMIKTTMGHLYEEHKHNVNHAVEFYM